MARAGNAALIGVAGVVLLVGSLAGPTTAQAAGWTTPRLISSTNFVDGDDGYSAISLTIDASGKLHAALSGVGRKTDGIWYASNRSGSWKLARATVPQGSVRGSAPHDFGPSIAVDIDGTVSIAFTRIDCTSCVPNGSSGVLYVEKTSGTWTKPSQIAKPSDWSHSPSLDVLNGRIYLAYNVADYDRQVIRYVTHTSSSGSMQKVVGAKKGVDLAVDAGGAPHLLAIAKNGALRFWNGLTASNLGSPETLPAGIGSAEVARLALDDRGRPTAAWATSDGHRIYVSNKRHGSWKAPQLLPDTGRVVGVDVDTNGKAHVLAIRDDGTLLYFTNRTGSWIVKQLYGGKVAAAAMVVDGNNRPRVLLTVGKSEPNFGLYYAVGPAS